MVDILFEMARIVRDDPKGRKYVLMVEHPERLKGDRRLIGTALGIKQNHKMRQLGLISYVGVDGACDGASKRIQAAYCITQKGMDLLVGLPITPWQIHVKNKRIVNMQEDQNTTGSIRDVKAFSYEQWKEQALNAKLFLRLPG
jgi:hypothetical protein